MLERKLARNADIWSLLAWMSGWDSLHLQQKHSERNSSILQEMVKIKVHSTWGADDDLEALYTFISEFYFKLSLGQSHGILLVPKQQICNLGLSFADYVASVNYYIHKAQFPLLWVSKKKLCICFRVFVHASQQYICPESYSGCVHQDLPLTANTHPWWGWGLEGHKSWESIGPVKVQALLLFFMSFWAGRIGLVL